MDGTAITELERLVRLAETKIITDDAGAEYSTRALHNLPRAPRGDAEPVPATLKLATLQSIADYVREKSCGAYGEDRGRFLHVEGPTSVRLVTGIFGEHSQQVVLARADAVVPTIQFGAWQDPEEFNIGLLAHFADAADRSRVLALTGSIKSDTSVTVKDDGVSQSVAGTRGVAFKENMPVPTTVDLQPWRTFNEIDPQPSSRFVLRVKAADIARSTGPKCALFEADGGVWRLEAIKRVKAWLKDVMTDEVPIFG